MSALRKLVIASGNPGKIREIERILAPLKIEVVSQSTLGVSPAEEPHSTFVENALAKARHVSDATGLAAIADDSGICVEALDGAPGVHSARYAGAPLSDERNNAFLLENMDGVMDRRAHYYCVIVLMRRANDPQPLIAEGEWQGEIVASPRGKRGFGYDPLFLDIQSGLTGAELSASRKNRISHRGKAMRKLLRGMMQSSPLQDPPIQSS
jgi:XTP/dITP diphosphohydrolase